MKPLKPLFLFTALILLVGLACSALGGGAPAPASTQPPPPTQAPVQVQPTESAPEPTEVPATEEAPATEVAPPAPSTSQFYTEEFDTEESTNNWDSFTLGSGKDTDLVIKQEDDHLLFDLGDKDLYVYYMYTPYEYDDVAIKLNAENRGRNNNNVSLVCRMSSDGKQWYEFSVESGGLWYLYAVDGKYNIISNGGTQALKQGKEINEYAMTCKGDEITLSINDQKVKTVTDTMYGFNSGLVGFNISSLNVLPITVNVNSFEISQP
ncbi:MAG TPA: hypothetical protein VKB04_02565 [Anaerolineales bacterium]|nr:hypothetical protein [Anaerolineales bacterium]